MEKYAESSQSFMILLKIEKKKFKIPFKSSMFSLSPAESGKFFGQMLSTSIWERKFVGAVGALEFISFKFWTMLVFGVA